MLVKENPDRKKNCNKTKKDLKYGIDSDIYNEDAGLGTPPYMLRYYHVLITKATIYNCNF